MAEQALLPDPTSLHLLHRQAEGNVITLVVRTTACEAKCSLCEETSTRVHSRYTRLLADLPCIGHAVRLKLHLRRFFCEKPECQRRIFAERLPHVVAPYARRTLRLHQLLTLIGFAVGGEAGRKLVAGRKLSTSPDTLLRLIHTAQDPSHATPRVLAVDDFAFRRRRTYGTILIDLEKHLPVDLLPDREAETLAKWLIEHPGVELVSRDRGGDYAKGAKQGAPDAKQRAARWHLVKHLSESMHRSFLRKPPPLKAASAEPTSNSAQEAGRTVPWHTGMTKRHEDKSQQDHQERVERSHEIQELFAKQVDVANIARQVGLSRQGVYLALQMKQPPPRTRIHRPGGSNLEP
jgi:transposase